MNLTALRNSFKNHRLSKKVYIRKMHLIHDRLFEYASYIKNTDIKKIEITDGRVVMTSRIDNIKMLCDPKDYRIAPIETLNFGAYEKSELDLLVKLIAPKSTIFDIGANFGWYSLALKKQIKDSIVYAFEPVPSTFTYLKANIDLNGLEDIYPQNFGFSDKRGKFDFYFYPEGSGNASTADLSQSPMVKKIACKLTTIDDYMQKNKKIKIDFLKCDVEGAELPVFKGGKNTLIKNKPIIFSEMLRKWTKPFNYHPNDLIAFLRDIDYRCFFINKNRLKEIKKINDQTIPTNFIFLNNRKHSPIIQKYAG